MKKYCITGVNGYIGSLLGQKFVDENIQFIGLDMQADKGDKDYPYHQVNIMDKDKLNEIFQKEKVDVLIHLAAYGAPEGDEQLAYNTNVKGTENVIAAAKAGGMKRIVLSSSAAAYGSHPDNPVPMTEDHPLRANDNYYYSVHKKTQEEVVKTFLKKNPKINYMILRLCIVLGKNINNPTGVFLKSPFLVNPPKSLDTPIQFIHENDVVEVLYLAAKSSKSAIMNVAPDHPTTVREMAKTTGKILIKAPLGIMTFFANLSKALRLSSVGGKSLNFTMNPIVVDTTLLKKTLPFKPNYKSVEVLVDYLAEIKKN